MIDLAKAKNYLNIDFNDNDNYIQSLVDAVKARALSITGISQTITVDGIEVDNPAFDNPELDNAMLMDIAEMYQSRGGVQSGSSTAVATYRRHSVKPMF